MDIRAFICGCAGPELSGEERAFLEKERPWGFILFRRNIESADQVRALTADLRAAAGHDAPVFIDQEGGRVQRLAPPLAPAYPPGRAYGALYAMNRERGLEAARLGARLIGHDLMRLGIDADCLPVLDLAWPETHAVIGDRAYDPDPDIVAALGRAAMEGLSLAGVMPVVKHIPGHGRARADSHLELPVVDAPRDQLKAQDFRPFKALADAPLAMTAHIVYPALDPDGPATTSAAIIGEVIRAGIGFDGALMSDDVSMKALSGSIGDRVRALFRAGCDLALHCNGDMAEMRQVAALSPPIAGKTRDRLERARAWPKPDRDFDAGAGAARFAGLMAPVWPAVA